MGGARSATAWAVAACLGLALLPAVAGAQVADWKRQMDAAGRANREGRYVEAEKALLDAVKAARGFGAEDPRLASSLNFLASVYREQGRYGEAETHYKQALAIREKTLGPEHPAFAATLADLGWLYAHPMHAQLLENLGKALRALGRVAEAEEAEARAAIVRTMR